MQIEQEHSRENIEIFSRKLGASKNLAIGDGFPACVAREIEARTAVGFRQGRAVEAAFRRRRTSMFCGATESGPSPVNTSSVLELEKGAPPDLVSILPRRQAGLLLEEHAQVLGVLNAERFAYLRERHARF